MNDNGITFDVIKNIAGTVKELSELKIAFKEADEEKQKLKNELPNEKNKEDTEKLQQERDNISIELLEAKGQLELINEQLKSKTEKLDSQKDDLKRLEDIE